MLARLVWKQQHDILTAGYVPGHFLAATDNFASLHQVREGHTTLPFFFLNTNEDINLMFRRFQ